MEDGEREAAQKVSNRQIGDRISWALMFVVILGRTRLPGYDIADILRW